VVPGQADRRGIRALRRAAEGRREKNTQKSREAAGALIEKYNGTAYADMAALLSAKVQAEAGDLKNARVPLAWAATKASDPALRELARLRLATVMFDDKAYDEALAQLQAPTDESLVARFADLKGDILLAQGKREEARAAYKAVVTALETTTKSEAAALREIAQAKLTPSGRAMKAHRLAELVAALARGRLQFAQPVSSGRKAAGAQTAWQPGQDEPRAGAPCGDAGVFVFQPAISGGAVLPPASDGEVTRIEWPHVWKTPLKTRVSGGVGIRWQSGCGRHAQGRGHRPRRGVGQVKWRVSSTPRCCAARPSRAAWWWCAVPTAACSASTPPTASAAGRTSGPRRAVAAQRGGRGAGGQRIIAGFRGQAGGVNGANGSLMWEGTLRCRAVRPSSSGWPTSPACR
jgi:predicted negative regulator of RcsB-dependent stress response